MHTRITLRALALSLALTLVLIAGNVLAAGQKEPEIASDDVEALYAEGKKAADMGDYGKALGYFEKAHDADADNPDVLNMLAYSQRKTGEIDQAIANYQRALELKPRFPEAREYLGEAYIQAALREIETLKSYGAEAEHELEELVEAFKEAAEGLD